MSRSDKIKKGEVRAPHRSLMYALGLEKEDFDKPFIGIANSFNETIPGHVHLRQVVESIKEGIYKNGGIPFEFNTIGICDGIAMNHEGMSYSLASRQIICDSVVVQAKGFPFDGIVFVPNCDKVVPGMLMAAAKLNLPSVFISGGSMLAGKSNNDNTSLTTVFEAVGQYQNNEITAQELEEYEQSACPTCGSCSGMYTANTMNCLSEALGIALPGNGTIPAVYAKRTRLYKQAGRKIIDLVENDKKFLDVVTKESFENAIACDMALAGSTNTVLHLMAIAKYANVDITLEDFDRISKKVPQLTKLSPASTLAIEDFDAAGGMMALMGELARKELLNDTKTIINDSLYNQVAGAKILDSRVIATLDDPINKTSGLTVLHGNLASQGAIVKTGAITQSQMYFKGRARVFENEDLCVDYLLNNKFNEGEKLVLIIRNMGIKGGYGMPEMLTPTSLIKGLNIGEDVALLTDGRFSGGSNGLVIGHISPEASEGGLIGVVQDNDVIEIDITKKEITLEVSSDEIDSRMNSFEPKVKKSDDFLDVYTKLADNASRGGGVH